MSISVVCQQCNKSYRVNDELAGKRGKCPQGHALLIPQLATEAKPIDTTATREPATTVANVSSSSGRGKECPSCKSKMSLEAILCVECGFDVRKGKKVLPKVERGKVAAEPEPEPEAGNRPGMLYAGLGVMVLATVVAVYFLVVRGPRRNESPSPSPAPSAAADKDRDRSAAAPDTIYDGEWEGKSSEGLPVQFTVRNGHVQIANINWKPRTAAAADQALGGNSTAKVPARIHVTRFSMTTDPEVVCRWFAGGFTSPDTAIGTVDFFHDNVGWSATWEARKTAIVAEKANNVAVGGEPERTWELVKVVSENEVLVLPDRVVTNYGKFLRITIRFSGPSKNRSLDGFDVADEKGMLQGVKIKSVWQDETTALITFTGVAPEGDVKGLVLTDGKRSIGLESAVVKPPAPKPPPAQMPAVVVKPQPPMELVPIGPTIQEVVADCPDILPAPQPGANSSLDFRTTGKNSAAKTVRWKGKIETIDKADPTLLEIIVESDSDAKGNRTVYQANLKLKAKPEAALAKGQEIWVEGVVGPRMMTGRDFRPTLLTHHYVNLQDAKIIPIAPVAEGVAPRARPKGDNGDKPKETKK